MCDLSAEEGNSGLKSDKRENVNGKETVNHRQDVR